MTNLEALLKPQTLFPWTLTSGCDIKDKVTRPGVALGRLTAGLCPGITSGMELVVLSIFCASLIKVKIIWWS